MDWTELFCSVDDFCQQFEPIWFRSQLESGERNRVFKGLAARGKTTMDWFYGFKVHLVINAMGELLAFHITPGNTDDREPVPTLAKHLSGKLLEDLLGQGVQLITYIRSNMKNKLMSLIDKLLLRKRSLIETVNDQLKNIAQIEYTWHRSPKNFFVHLLAALISYTHKPKKPHINMSNNKRNFVTQKQLPNFA